MRMLRFASALAGAGLWASLAAAFPGSPAAVFEPRPDEIIASHADELGIDAATLDKIHALGEQHRAERDVIVAALQEQKLALRKLLESEHPTESAAIALARKIGTLETDLSVARLSAMMRMHALLTPAQNAALHEQMRTRFVARRVQLDAVTNACRTELAEHCQEPDGSPGPPLMCLLHKRQAEGLTVGSACDAALRELPPPRFFRFEAPPPPAGSGEPFDVFVPAPPEAEEGE